MFYRQNALRLSVILLDYFDPAYFYDDLQNFHTQVLLKTNYELKFYHRLFLVVLLYFPSISLDHMAIFPEKILTYWSGNDGAYGRMSRPGGSGNYFANAAGIMLTRKQVDHLDSICPGKYLPPFSDRMWRGHRYV